MATPKNPFSGLIAYNFPSFFRQIQAISSPIVSTFQPGIVGTNIDRFVFPQALGKAPKIYLYLPSGFVIFKMSICSAIHPSSFAILDATLKAKHFFPSSAFPPYPEP